MSQPEPILEGVSLSRAFGASRGVREVSIAVRPGEVFGFLGPNGAGKTTTIRLLLDLLRPDRGEVRVFGRSHAEQGPGVFRRMGFVPGDLALFEGSRGRRVLELFGRLRGAPPLRRDELLERLGFPHEALRRRVRTYSTGMRQMLGLTAALQHDPELAVLDEPSTGLDPLVREALLEIVRDRRSRGLTTFFSSHVLDEVERCADRVALIADGRLLMTDTMRDLRMRWPRRIIQRYANGEERESRHSGPAIEILDRIEREGLIDLEIRPPTLEEMFREVIGGGSGDAVQPTEQEGRS